MKQELVEKVKSIIADVMCLDGADQIGNQAALFDEVGLSSLDFIDVCYELESQINRAVTMELIWPIPSMMEKSDLWSGKEWTTAGRERLGHLLGGAWGTEAPADALTPQALRRRFTVEFIVGQLESLER